MRQQLCAVTAITLASQSFCCWRNGKRWVLGERRCCRPLTAHRTQDTVQATHRTNASHQESANPLQPLPALLSHHIASHGKSSRGRRGTYTLSLFLKKKGFAGKASPGLSLTASLSHCGAGWGSGWVLAAGYRSGEAASTDCGGTCRCPPLRTTCRRGRCSPHVSTRWHLKYFNPPHPGYAGKYEAECQNLTVIIDVTFML